MTIFEIAKRLISDIGIIYPVHAELLTSAFETLEGCSCKADGIGKTGAFGVMDTVLDKCEAECPACRDKIGFIKDLVKMGRSVRCGGG